MGGDEVEGGANREASGWAAVWWFGESFMKIVPRLYSEMHSVFATFLGLL